MIVQIGGGVENKKLGVHHEAIKVLLRPLQECELKAFVVSAAELVA